jgi:hypothetical protein
MHSALIAVEVPQSRNKWRDFVADVDNLGSASPDPLYKHPGIALLGDNVWLLNFHKNPGGFARIVTAAAKHNLKYGILQFDAAPQWFPDGFNPETISPAGASLGSG